MKKYFILSVVVLWSFSVQAGVLASWELDGQPGNQASSPAKYVSEFINGVPTLIRTSTIGSSGQLDTFSMRANHQTSLQAAIDSSVYITWTLTAVEGYWLTITGLALNVSANNTQDLQPAREVSLFSSATGWGADHALDSWDVKNWGARSIDLSSLAAFQNVGSVEFRLVAWNATGSAPEFHFTSIGRNNFTDGANDLVVSGTTAAIPEPVVSGLIVIGGLFTLLIRRHLS